VSRSIRPTRAPGNKQVKLSDLLGKGPVVIYTFVDAFGAA
jgi:peroxiredoxin